MEDSSTMTTMPFGPRPFSALFRRAVLASVSFRHAEIRIGHNALANGELRHAGAGARSAAGCGLCRKYSSGFWMVQNYMASKSDALDWDSSVFSPCFRLLAFRGPWVASACVRWHSLHPEHAGGGGGVGRGTPQNPKTLQDPVPPNPIDPIEPFRMRWVVRFS